MKYILSPIILIFALTLSACSLQKKETAAISYEKPVKFSPPEYVCYRTTHPITIDGKMNPDEWKNIPWTADFTDIEGDKRPAPYLQTRAKMAWDNDGMYFASLMEEPHVWGTITEHDAVIYQDNDFEIFLNPSGDTHNYLEYEVNALGTVWDLYLSKPYRDGPAVLNNWEFTGMKSAVHIDGTINDPSDVDRSWSVEVFIPWESIYQPVRRKEKPQPGEQMRVNFSRVQWITDISEGKYKKTPMPGETEVREHNWVWAPTEVVDIHRPEFWGFVQFSDKSPGEDTFILHPDEELKWTLRNLYYRQATYFRAFGHYAKEPADLQIQDICSDEQVNQIEVYTTPSTYEIILSNKDTRWHIRQDGLVWKSIVQ